jgi:hypothetical protein
MMQTPLNAPEKILSFENPANGYRKDVFIPAAFIWCLLFGPLYFIVQGNWRHAVAAFVLASVTAGISWVIYPFFIRRITETHYMRMGWRRVFPHGGPIIDA